jgi:hypothetical protein
VKLSELYDRLIRRGSHDVKMARSAFSDEIKLKADIGVITALSAHLNYFKYLGCESRMAYTKFHAAFGFIRREIKQ